uniref:PSI domain-containing protein n=1 Tax=Hemiselmis andersenii TaxID=464988 RepID=A0A6U4PVI1_HEMAN|mmetsp:Transcript_22414/g.52006  ORF Transcript_22414/g.52006 Transcript_22414/m.52006 type:complete len:117 (+) Transcript_22414:168-518(+)|eukprot:CAMPEP_0114129902 /NCGR_PEP_ID=MMETSP0043_2-20121206/11722_1 /TAXON_ID=464988 /ORGANISM="Hemiselmis andersenii, Strain CCMP644" /LENGTH=116 /DNA_ID=CAMNT_0001223207 /DNA_START=157 /DNA_END=507 /DNA_ORIENTATION=-
MVSRLRVVTWVVLVVGLLGGAVEAAGSKKAGEKLSAAETSRQASAAGGGFVPRRSVDIRECTDFFPETCMADCHCCVKAKCDARNAAPNEKGEYCRWDASFMAASGQHGQCLGLFE